MQPNQPDQNQQQAQQEIMSKNAEKDCENKFPKVAFVKFLEEEIDPEDTSSDTEMSALYEINGSRKFIVGFSGTLAAMLGMNEAMFENTEKMRPFVMFAYSELWDLAETDKTGHFQKWIFDEYNTETIGQGEVSFDEVADFIRKTCDKCGSDNIKRIGPFAEEIKPGEPVPKQGPEQNYGCWCCENSWIEKM